MRTGTFVLLGVVIAALCVGMGCVTKAEVRDAAKEGFAQAINPFAERLDRNVKETKRDRADIDTLTSRVEVLEGKTACLKPCPPKSAPAPARTGLIRHDVPRRTAAVTKKVVPPAPVAAACQCPPPPCPEPKAQARDEIRSNPEMPGIIMTQRIYMPPAQVAVARIARVKAKDCVDCRP